MIKCQVCQTRFEDEDKVVLDIANGLSHQVCYTEDVSKIKDFSTYSNIVYSYSFLQI